MSRVKSLDGLYLTRKIDPSDVKVNEGVVAYITGLRSLSKIPIDPEWESESHAIYSRDSDAISQYYFDRAMGRLGRGDVNLVYQDLMKSVAYMVDDTTLHISKTSLLEVIQNDLDRFLRPAGSDSDFICSLVWYYVDRYDNAMVCMDRYLDVINDDVANFFASKIAFKLRRIPEAIDYINKAILQSGNARNYLHKAICTQAEQPFDVTLYSNSILEAFIASPSVSVYSRVHSFLEKHSSVNTIPKVEEFQQQLQQSKEFVSVVKKTVKKLFRKWKQGQTVAAVSINFNSDLNLPTNNISEPTLTADEIIEDLLADEPEGEWKIED